MASMQDELFKLGKEIESAKKMVNQLEGRREEIMSRLKKEYDCESIDDATKLLKTMEADAAKIEIKIQKSFDELKESFSW